jgi:hypothetical protein
MLLLKKIMKKLMFSEYIGAVLKACASLGSASTLTLFEILKALVLSKIMNSAAKAILKNK